MCWDSSILIRGAILILDIFYMNYTLVNPNVYILDQSINCGLNFYHFIQEQFWVGH